MARIKSKKYIGLYLNQLKNGDITYYVTYKDKHGKKVFHKIGKKSEGITEIYANTKRNEFIHKINLDEDPIAHKKKQEVFTLDDLADVFFDTKEKKRSDTMQKQKYDLHIKKVLGRKNIELITKQDIKRLQEKLQKEGKANKTVNGIIQLLSSIYNHNIKEHDLKMINPCTGVKRLKVDDARERYLTKDEVQNLLAEVADDETLSLFVLLALNTGGRLVSVLNIRKKDFNLTGNSVTIKDLKGDKTYTGFYDDDLKEYLQEYLKPLQPNTYVIGKKDKPPLTRTIQDNMKVILDVLFNQGLDKRDSKNRVVIHTLRHTFASHLAIKGTPIFTIQKLMNHADITHTMRYAKLAPDQGLDVVKGLYKNKKEITL